MVMIMQMLEALLSLVFFIWAATLAVSSYHVPEHDDSLYLLHITGDAWRVMYLRGQLNGVHDLKSLEPALDEIDGQTGMCLFINGIESTSCRGGKEDHEIKLSLRRALLVDGEPQSVTFSVGN